jgi:hypothetical protein
MLGFAGLAEAVSAPVVIAIRGAITRAHKLNRSARPGALMARTERVETAS